MESPQSTPHAEQRPTDKGPVRVGRLIGGIALCVVALVLVLGGIGGQVAATWLAKRSPEAEAQGPGKLTFDATDAKYTIALGTSEDSWSNFELSKRERWDKFRVYDGDVAAARCTIDHPSGKDDTVRGDRQGMATTQGVHYATVGTFTGRGGKTTVSCSFAPPTETRFGDGKSLGKREVERIVPFMVHERGGLLNTLSWVALVIGLALAALGTLQILRATVLRGRSIRGGVS